MCKPLYHAATQYKDFCWFKEKIIRLSKDFLDTCTSDIVLCACSNKSIEVFDLNTGQMVRKMTDVHSRPVHALCQNEVSFGFYIVFVFFSFI
jgi:hypothetical protein